MNKVATVTKEESAGRPVAAEGYARWPLIPLYLAAGVAIWGGWVELGRMSGFGPTEMLPGISDWTIDLAIVLPIGMEAYAAYALGVWLTRKAIAPEARTFARWSALSGLLLGTAGQMTFHALRAAGHEVAPLPVVVLVAAVPVATLAAASILTHKIGPGRRNEPATPAAAEIDSTPPTADGTEPDQTPMDQVARPVSIERPAEPTTGRRRPVTDDERERIVAAAIEAGDALSERALAREFGRSRDTISRVLAEAGVPGEKDRPEYTNRSPVLPTAAALSA